MKKRFDKKLFLSIACGAMLGVAGVIFTSCAGGGGNTSSYKEPSKEENSSEDTLATVKNQLADLYCEVPENDVIVTKDNNTYLNHFRETDDYKGVDIYLNFTRRLLLL